MTERRDLRLADVLRPIYRRHAKAHAEQIARGISRQSSNAAEMIRGVRRSPKVRKWGYTLRLHAIGPVLRFFVRGRRGQRPRPVDMEYDGLAQMQTEIVDAVNDALTRWGRVQRRPSGSRRGGRRRG